MWCNHVWSIAGLLFVFLPFCTWAQTNSVDCKHVPCVAPLTQTPLGSPCGCVLPMQVELELNVTLAALFPAIPALTGEIAYGTLLLRSQVRVVGAIADSQDQSKSIATINLVPLGKFFDNLTAIMIFQRLWNHQVFDSNSYFSNYRLIYVYYPGLPSSTPFPYPSNTTSGEVPGTEILPHEQPLSVNVSRGVKKFHGGTFSVIILSCAIGAAAASGVIVLLLIKFNSTGFRTMVKAIRAQKSPGKVARSSNDFDSSLSRSLSYSMATYTISARTFSLYELERATDNFNTKNVIGQGASGRVFAGILEDGSKVAVKTITRDNQQKRDEFLSEVEMLSRLHHRNLVKLIGVCTEEHSCCLVYELVSNGSVESHLHGSDKVLDWNARMKIALGAARGLAYLHEDADPHVIHRDFKASNILIEKDFTPKISDFGLAKEAPDGEHGHISTSVMGTFGYVAPEYAMTGHLLVKNDVYSYGVVLLELLSGKRPIDLSQPSGQESLVSWARPLLTSEEGLDILADPNLEGRYPSDIFARVVAIASMCIQPEVYYRPFMGEVVQALKTVSNITDEEVSSLTVSPQGSGDARSDDVDGEARDDGSGPLINTNWAALGRATISTVERLPSFSTRLSDSQHSHSPRSDSHTLADHSISIGTDSWSKKQDNAFVAYSELRVYSNRVKGVRGEMCGSWP